MIKQKELNSQIKKLAPWVKIWAWNWSFLSCSHFGEEYTQILQFEGKNFAQHAILFIYDGKSSAYLPQKERDIFGKYVAGVVTENSKKIKMLSVSLMENVDIVLSFMKKHLHDEPNLITYDQFWTAIDMYYPHHIAVKYVVDFLKPDLLKKNLPTLQEARLYAEPVFVKSEEFIITWAEKIAIKTGYKRENILCLLKDEIRAYLKNDTLPEEKIFTTRQDASALYFTSKKTLLVTKKVLDLEKEVTSIADNKTLKGQVAYLGKVSGVVKIVLDPAKCKNFNEGDILVTGMTRPDYLSLMHKASAFITDAGEILSHAAIVARELKKPCIIGTQIATKILKDGDLVEVDADNGVIKILKKAI